MKLTRKRQLGALIVLSALTAAAQYVIQGSISTGADPREFPPLFWYIDYFFWAFRGLVEAWVVIYLFTTNVKGVFKNVVLTALEVALLALITFTVGPALQAVGQGVPVYTVLEELYGTWQYAIGAYTALMMAGAGFAYKFQPFDLPDEGKPKTTRKRKPAKLETCPLCSLQVNGLEKHRQFHLNEVEGMGQWQSLAHWQKEYGEEELKGAMEWLRA